MKRLMAGLVCILVSGVVWAETDPSPLKQETQLKERARTRVETQLQEQTRLQLRAEECEQLMLQVKSRTRTQAEYQENLEFMLAYAFRNRDQGVADLDAASDFYQKNRTLVSGTARQKRLALMVKSEQHVRNRLETKNAAQTQLKEQNRNRHTEKYQSGYREKNISKNKARTDDIQRKQDVAAPRR